MLPENKERRLPERTVVEFCGTPFAARGKFLVHNAIEDMVSERVGQRIDALSGMMSFGWLSTIDKNSRLEFFEQIHRVQEMIVRSNFSEGEGIVLVEHGAFAAMVATEVSKKAGIISEEETHRFNTGLLPYVQMEDLIMITLVRPRAAMVRELYPEDLEGHDEIMRRK